MESDRPASLRRSGDVQARVQPRYSHPPDRVAAQGRERARVVRLKLSICMETSRVVQRDTTHANRSWPVRRDGNDPRMTCIVYRSSCLRWRPWVSGRRARRRVALAAIVASVATSAPRDDEATPPVLRIVRARSHRWLSVCRSRGCASMRLESRRRPCSGTSTRKDCRRFLNHPAFVNRRKPG